MILHLPQEEFVVSGIIERGNDCVKDVPKFLVGHVLNHKFSDKVEGKVSILVEE